MCLHSRCAPQAARASPARARAAPTFACRTLYQEEQVALVPGVAFGDPECLRISYATSMELLKSAMERISRAFSKLSRPE